MRGNPTEDTVTNASGKLWERIELIRQIAAVPSTQGHEGRQNALACVMGAIGCDAASLYLRLSEEDPWEEHACQGGSVNLPVSVETAVYAGTPDTKGLTEAQLLDQEHAPDEGDPFRAVVAAPVCFGDRTLGLLMLGFRGDEPVDGDTLKLSSLAASMMVRAADVVSSPEIEEAAHGVAVEGLSEGNLAEAAELAVATNHRLNNSLAVIIGNVQYLQLDKQIASPDVLARLQRIEQAAVRISMTSQKLLRIHWLASEGCRLGAANLQNGNGSDNI